MPRYRCSEVSAGSFRGLRQPPGLHKAPPTNCSRGGSAMSASSDFSATDESSMGRFRGPVPPARLPAIPPPPSEGTGGRIMDSVPWVGTDVEIQRFGGGGRELFGPSRSSLLTGADIRQLPAVKGCRASSAVTTGEAPSSSMPYYGDLLHS